MKITVLTGGTSRMPLLASAIEARLPKAATRRLKSFHSVVHGLARRARELAEGARRLVGDRPRARCEALPARPAGAPWHGRRFMNGRSFKNTGGTVRAHRIPPPCSSRPRFMNERPFNNPPIEKDNRLTASR